jgi:hypothetical protein
MFARAVALLFLGLACTGRLQAEVGLAELRAGGYLLYMRHAATVFGQNDAGMKNYEDCANQRNLADKGRAEARGGPAYDAERYAGLKKLMSTPVEKGRNRVIVSHGNPFQALAGPPCLAEGEIAVLEPKGSGFEVVRRIGLEDWQALQ